MTPLRALHELMFGAFGVKNSKKKFLTKAPKVIQWIYTFYYLESNYFGNTKGVHTPRDYIRMIYTCSHININMI